MRLSKTNAAKAHCRGVIWGGWGAVAPQGKRKKKKERKKKKKEREKEKKRKKEGNYE